MTQTKRPGIAQALFGELDEKTRREYGLPGSQPGQGAPRAAPTALRDLRPRDWLGVAKGTARQVGADRVSAVAAGVTFFGLLSLFPAITAFVSLYALVANPGTIARHLEILASLMPAGALDIIRGQVEAIAASPTNALSVAGIGGLLIAFYSANGGMKALLSGLNVAFFENESRGFIKLNLVAMAFTVSGLLLIALMMGVIAVIPAVLAFLPMAETSEKLIAALRWPAVFVVLVLALAAIYRWGPSRRMTRWRWISPGAIFAAVGFVASSYLFSWYAANFADYNETYGSLGAVVLLMMWLWINATVVLIGAELNAELERRLKFRQAAPDES